MEEKYLTLSQASEQLGVSTTTLRRLCNYGLVPGVRRDRRGHRVLKEWQVNHMGVILRLKEAGLNKLELKRYVKLFRQGHQALAQRKALLETWRRQLWQELEARQRGIDMIERQVELIDQGGEVDNF